VLACFYEKTGIFTLRSTYKLALNMDQETKRQEGSSAIPDGRRLLYKGIWAARVPPKVCVFAWRLAQEGLATQSNRMTEKATCQICGNEDENGHHAVVSCTKALALRHEMRDKWFLPDEEQFRYSGPDWLLLLLASVDEETAAHILLILWRAWYLRNDIVHGNGTCLIVGSVKFLMNYSESLKKAKKRWHKEAGWCHALPGRENKLCKNGNRHREAG
jgi:hypothetical protein